MTDHHLHRLIIWIAIAPIVMFGLVGLSCSMAEAVEWITLKMMIP